MSFPKNPRNPRMAYSGLTNMMRRLFAAYSEADETGVPVDEVLDMQRERAELRRQQMQSVISRRAFIKGAAAAGMAAAAGKTLQTVGRVAASGDPNVVIIGAGLAGLRCAHKLANHGVASTVYEASQWIGGRTFSDTFSFPGQVVERGGSFISTEHNQIRNLANNLGLSLEVINGGALLEGEELYFIDGNYYTIEDANEDWGKAWKAFKQELNAAPWLQRFDSYTQRGWELDNMSVPDWFSSNPILAEEFGPNPTDSRFAKLCFTDCIAEYGGEANEQPALNLLYLLAWNNKNNIVPLAGTDEKYHVVGGNQQIAERLIETMSLNVETNRALEAITGAAAGPYTCYFSSGTPVVADKLVLALPFSILKDIEIDPAIWNSFTPQKQAAINSMPMGTNAKIHLMLANRTWGPDHVQEIPAGSGIMRTLNGVTYSDPDGFQLNWDDSVPVPIGQGPVQLVNYLGGNKGASLQNSQDPMGTPHMGDLNAALEGAESIFPGTIDQFNAADRIARQSNWAASQWHKGAYAFWGIGGYTTYVGAAGTPEGNIHFAGEHTSEEYQGYMEGAVETGRRAADEVRMSI